MLMDRKVFGWPIFLIIAFAILASGGILLGLNSQVSDGLKNPNDLNITDSNSPDVNVPRVGDLNIAEREQMIEDANCSGWGFFLHSDSDFMVSFGFGLCWFENTVGGMLKSFGLDPAHVYFGLILILGVVALLSYFATEGSSKMMWILILCVIVVGILLVFRAT